MYAARLNRKDFLDWVGTGKVPLSMVSETTGPQFLHSPDVSLIWDRKPTARNPGNPLVVIGDAHMLDLYAYTSTYISTHFPFSAFFKVLNASEAEAIFRRRGGKEGEIRAPLVSLIMAEAYVQMGGKAKTVSEIPISACMATYSASAIQLASQGGGVHELAKMSDSWADCRSLLRSDPLTLQTRDLESFWRAILPLFNVERDDAGVHEDVPWARYRELLLREFSQFGRVSPPTWEKLTNGLPKSTSALQSMGESKERRIRALDEATRELLSDTGADTATRELVAGFLVAMAAGGSLQYLSLIEPFRASFPRSALWYAFFCALSDRNDVMTIGECLGRRLARDLLQTRDVFEQLDCDIASEELRLVLSDGESKMNFRRARHSVVKVEVYPGVHATFRATPHRENDEIDTKAVERNKEIRYLLSRIGRLMDETDAPRRQRDLFDDRSRRRFER